MLLKIIRHELSKQFFKFGIVGGINTLIHLSLLYLMVEFFGIWYILASFLAFLVAVTNSFILNTAWTFGENIRHKTIKRYTKFFIVSSFAAILNILFLYAFTEWVGLWYMFSQGLAILLTLAINFVGNKLWTYQ